ncbi:MAG: glycosyltransferase [Candidatus Gracilibacteria bacterium]|nr:glycosyltransferase [Candidatus Gracilibacteria bacterium]
MKNIALTGGGTGGHIFPLLSIYNYLKSDENLNFVWFGDEYGLEYDICEENNIKFEHIPSGKLRRYFDIKNFFEPLKNLTGFFFGIYFLLKYKIDIVFSKGGFVSIPLCLAAFVLRKKIYIHESDTVGGLANKIISKVATKIFYTFPNENNLEENEKNIITGQILNPELLNNIDKIGNLEENEKLEVLVIAGSQGSSIIFENLKTILNNLIDVNFTIILGEKNLDFRNEFEKFHNVKLYDFASQEKLGEIYKNTDIAISRGGATSLWELYYFGIHTIIVPIKNSAGNHQFENAMYFKDKFGSDVLNEEEKLNLEIFRLLNKYKHLIKIKSEIL